MSERWDCVWSDNGFSWRKNSDSCFLFDNKKEIARINLSELSSFKEDKRFPKYFYLPFLRELFNAIKLPKQEIPFPIKHTYYGYKLDYTICKEKNFFPSLTIDSSLIMSCIDDFAWEVHLWPTQSIKDEFIALLKSESFIKGAISNFEVFLTNTKVKNKEIIIPGAFHFIRGLWSIESVFHEVIHALYKFNDFISNKEISLENVLQDVTKYNTLPKRLLEHEEKVATIFGVLSENIIEHLKDIEKEPACSE